MSREDWVWCGYAGHFIASASCLMHMHTRVGDYRISTVGDYRPVGPDQPACPIGLSRLYETFVFRVEGDGEHGEGEVTDWSEIDTDGYMEAVDAELGHVAMCEKYDLIAADEARNPEGTPPSTEASQSETDGERKTA